MAARDEDRLTPLVVVIGPIASGKSGVSSRVTEILSEAGLAVACADVDDVADMLHAARGKDRHWPDAHLAHGMLVHGLLQTTVDVVVAHGPIYTREETDALMDQVPSGTPMVRVLLQSTLETALLRVGQEPGRGASSDPDFLRDTYERFDALLPQLDRCDLAFDTVTEPIDSIAAQIADHVLQEWA